MKMGGARSKLFGAAVFMGVVMFGFQNCSPRGFQFKGQPGASPQEGVLQNGGTTTDNPKPTVTLQIGAFANIDSTDNAPPQIFLCISEIRFRKPADDGDDVRIELRGERKYVTLNPTGTDLGPIDVPSGNYGRIELRLSEACDGIAAAVRNTHGDFSTDEDTDLRFSGSIANNGNLSRLVLNMDEMVRDLAEAQNANQLERILSESEGSCGGD